jgi:hypothetical protein
MKRLGSGRDIMAFIEPYNTWIKTKVGENIDDKTRFILKVTSTTPSGPVENSISLDLVWFILIHAEDTAAKKIQMAQGLLGDLAFYTAFQNTFDNEQNKRLITEFLMYNFEYLNAFKQYIDFAKLNVPTDFISHALFIKRAQGDDTDEINQERIKIVKLVLEKGYNGLINADLPVLHKVLTMFGVEQKYSVAKRLVALGFKLFLNNNPRVNAEVAVALIDGATNPDANEMIQNNVEIFKSFRMQIPGSTVAGNLVDYYYWVKEDMEAVNYLKQTLGLQLSPTT